MSVDKRVTLQPPDGGWGWMIVFGNALSHLFLIPLVQNFTLIFKEKFIELGFSSTDITTLVTLNVSFGMILGIINGPLLKTFGYRKLALTGTTFYVVGNLCSGIAKSYIEFVIYYGMITSIGLNMTMASFSLALNTYFLKNRSKAVAYAMVLTGVGPILIPLLISQLLSSYGVKWTVFILSGLTLNIYVGALLLQPVKRHMKMPPVFVLQTEEVTQLNHLLLPDANSVLDIAIGGSQSHLPIDSEKKSATLKGVTERYLKPRIISSLNNLNFDNPEKKISKNGVLKASLTHLDNDDYKNMMKSTLSMIERVGGYEKNVKYVSAETLKWSESEDESNCQMQAKQPLTSEPRPKENPPTVPHVQEPDKEGLFQRSIHFVKTIYDVDLLHDISFLNVLLGQALSLVGEVIFSVMTPLIFKEFEFNTQETAKFLAIIAGADLFSRFIAPFVAQKLKLKAKGMYSLSLMMLFVTRFALFLPTTYEGYFAVCFAHGIAKGFRSVFWFLILPEQVHLSKLPSASAFLSLTNGIFLLISGPLAGAVVAINNKYSNLIIASNGLSVVTLILWFGELIYVKYKKTFLTREST